MSVFRRGSRAFLCALAVAAAAIACPLASHSQTHGLIEAAASENYFSIEPGFNGTSVILFGSIDQDRIKGDMPDIAITLSGPEHPMTVWKKERRGAVWMNVSSFTFEAVPTFFATLSSRPLDDIAPVSERERYEIGLDSITFANSSQAPKAPAEYRAALVRLKRGNETFVENPDAIEWLGKRLFRAKITLPAAAGDGLYRARILLLHNRKVIGETAAQVTLQKVGIERFLSSSSTGQPWFYGASAVLLAAAIGTAASFVLRRR